MPSPLLLSRPGGLYCRFLVPRDLRQVFGRRFIVRSLGACHRDEARLIAAAWAVELGIAFKAIREEHTMDINELLGSLDPQKIRDFGAKKITVGGMTIEGVQVKSDDDLKRLNAFIAEHRAHTPAALAAPAKHPPEYLVLLSGRQNQRYEQMVIGQSSPKTTAEYKHSVQLMIDACGDKPPVDYTISDIDKLIDLIMHLPPNITKRKEFKNLTAVQAREQNEKANGKCITPRTMEKHLDRLRAFFTWCIKQRYHPGPNPLADKRLMSKEKRETKTGRAFTDDDLAKIFSREVYTDRTGPHQYWGPLLGLMTGARVNELAQLYVSDVAMDGQYPGIIIAERHPDQRVKNKYSVRAIPLHPKLIALGFIEYVEDVKAAGFERLFPMLVYSKANGYGDAMADTFHRGLLRSHSSIGKSTSASGRGGRRAAVRAGIDDPAKTFHSFRHYFCSTLYQTQHDVVRVKELSGHERPGEFNKTYAPILNYGPKLLILNDLPVPTLDIPNYDREAGKAYLAALGPTLAAKAANREAKLAKKANPPA